jgi:hypothetical protein
VNTLCIDFKVGLGVVVKRYSTAVRNKTTIRCVRGPIATPPAAQVNTLYTDSKVGLGVVAKGGHPATELVSAWWQRGYPTAVRNKTTIRCIHGPTATSPTQQVNTLCIDSKDGLGVVAKGGYPATELVWAWWQRGYPTAVRSKTNIRRVRGPIATSPTAQVNILCIDSKVGLGVVAIPLMSWFGRGVGV